MEPESQPEVTAPVEKVDFHRPGPGWILFLLVVGFWISTQLYDYLGRKPAEEGLLRARSVESDIASSFKISEAFRRTTGQKGPDLKLAFEEAADSIEGFRKRNLESAMLYVALRDYTSGEAKPEDLTTITELAKKSEVDRKKSDPEGIPLEPEQIVILEKRTDAARAFVDIYSASKLAESEAKERIERLSDGFTYKLAAMAAWRKAGLKDPALKVFNEKEIILPYALLTGLMLTGGFGLLLWLVYFILRAQGQLKPVGHPAGDLSAADADRFAGKAGILLAAPLLVAAILQSAKLPLSRPGLSLVLSLTTLVATLALAATPIFGKRIRFRTLGWRGDRVLKDAFWGVCAACAGLPILAVVAIVSNFAFKGLPQAAHPATVGLSGQTDIWVLVATFVAASITAPIMEETIFRGFLVPAMSRATGGVVGGWIVAGLIFGSVHPTGIPVWLPLASIGAMAAAVNHQTGSLVSSVFMHAVHNAATLLFVLVLFS